MATDPADDIRAEGSPPWPERHSDENQWFECNGRSRAPPTDGLDYGLVHGSPVSGAPGYALMTHTENFARVIGTQIFGKW